MSQQNLTLMHAVIVEEEVQFTLIELGRACSADTQQLIALVDEGVLTPIGEAPPLWRFDGSSLRRARAALRLTRDLELTAAGAAMVLDLLDEIDALRSRLQRLGSR